MLLMHDWIAMRLVSWYLQRRSHTRLVRYLFPRGTRMHRLERVYLVSTSSHFDLYLCIDISYGQGHRVQASTPLYKPH